MKIQGKDGSRTTFHPNGDMETESANGTKVKIKHDGTVITSKKDGTEKTIHPNGITESVNSNGDRTIKKPDGEVIKIKHDGHVTSRNPVKAMEAKKEAQAYMKDAKQFMDILQGNF